MRLKESEFVKQKIKEALKKKKKIDSFSLRKKFTRLIKKYIFTLY
jgi:hypothetical protein